MKINFRDYEIEIKAKDTNYHDRANKEDTASILLSLAIWAAEAANRYDQLNCHTLQREARAFFDAVNETLEAAGM